jgi:phycocyanobilin lyase beta subunit
LFYLILLMSDSLESLIHAVDVADSSASLLAAVQHLSEAGLIGAIPTLISALSYNNPGAAVAAVDGLVKIGEPAVPAILEQLDGHNYTARAWAIRALASIGDSRGLTTLLGAATADFAMSVRRAAAKGLGSLKWHQFSEDELEIAQAEAMDALLFVCDDEEWVVRYAAVAGLQSLAGVIWNLYPDWRSPILAKFDAMANQDSVWAVKARVWMAQQQLQTLLGLEKPIEIDAEPHSEIFVNWRSTLENVYRRKAQERPLPEGDPRRFRGLAASLTSSNET